MLLNLSEQIVLRQAFLMPQLLKGQQKQPIKTGINQIVDVDNLIIK